MRARLERLIGDTAFLGTAIAYLTLIAHTVTLRWLPGWVSLPERILTIVVGTGLGIVFEPIQLLVLNGGYVWLPLVVAGLIWRRTRRAVALLAAAVLAFVCVRLAAVGIFSLYVMHHGFGLLAGPLAILPAVFLARWRRVPVVAVALLAGGISVGVLLGVIFQHDFPVIVTPLRRFVPIALVTLLLAGLIAWRSSPAPAVTVGRFARMWGLSAFSVACLMILIVLTDWLQPRAAPPNLFLPDSSYEVYLTGDPADLLWTDTVQIHVVTSPYGDHHDTYALTAGDHHTPQRIWTSPSDGFYVQMLYKIGWWHTPPRGERLAPDPAVLYENELLHDGSPCAFFEDPLLRHVFMVNAWGSDFVLMDRDTGATLQTGRVSTALLGGWHSTPFLAARLTYLSSAIEDGGLYELNLDTMAQTQKVSALFVYETMLDADQHLLWGARPLTGEVVGVDTRTYEVRHRFRTAFGARDLQRDARTGTLYTCSLSGDVFRIDPSAGAVETIAWCGRMCRNLFLDTSHDTLWAATDDGICRIPVPGTRGA